jgi:predicted transcriptional regulator
MTKNVKMIEENQTIQTVCKVMYDNGVGSLVVVWVDKDENLRPIGMITESDFNSRNKIQTIRGIRSFGITGCRIEQKMK